MDRPSFDAARQDASNQDPGICEGWSGALPPGAVGSTSSNDRQTDWLARTIEAEIIPRLMLAHRSQRLDFPPPEPDRSRPTLDDVVELSNLVLSRDAGASADFVRRCRERGMALEVIFLELLAPTARRLGNLWEADLCPFADVTVGLWRLQQVMHELSPDYQCDARTLVHSRRAALVPVPGSQHTLGLFIVAEFFRHAGWEVWGDAAVGAAEIGQAVRTQWFDLLGVSIGSETHIDALASVILDVRKLSRNPNVVVIIGGPIVIADPSLVTRVGADASAHDAPDAVARAERLVATRSMRS